MNIFALIVALGALALMFWTYNTPYEGKEGLKITLLVVQGFCFIVNVYMVFISL